MIHLTDHLHQQRVLRGEIPSDDAPHIDGAADLGHLPTALSGSSIVDEISAIDSNTGMRATFDTEPGDDVDRVSPFSTSLFKPLLMAMQ